MTAAGGGNALFRVQRGRREPIAPTDVEAMGISQQNIQEVDPLELLAMPLDVTRRRAVGRVVQTYLSSDLKAGHFMHSWVSLQGTNVDSADTDRNRYLVRRLYRWCES